MNEQLMLEYIFFHQETYDLFKHFLEDKGIEVLKEGIDQTDVEGYVIFIEDDLEESLNDQVEAFYDQLMDREEALVMQGAEEEEISQVGLAVSLKDDRSVLASVDPDTLNRILSVVTQQKLGEFVDAIADAVENPDDRPLCKR